MRMKNVLAVFMMILVMATIANPLLAQDEKKAEEAKTTETAKAPAKATADKKEDDKPHGSMAETVIMGVLAVCLVFVIAVIIQKFLFWLLLNSKIKTFKKDLAPVFESGDMDALKKICDNSKAPLADVIKKILDVKVPLRPDQVLLMMRNQLGHQAALLKKFLGILATMAGVAPFIGLLGTVLGILETFAAIGESGFSDPAAISVGISSALIATAFGLAVAIPAVMFYNFYGKKASAAIEEVERQSTDVLIIFGRI